MREVLNFVIDVVPIIILIAYFHILVSAIIKSTLQFKTTLCNFQQKKKTYNKNIRCTKEYKCFNDTHPWQLAHSSSRTESSRKAVSAVSVPTTASSPSASAAAPATSDPTAPDPNIALSTGAIIHHNDESPSSTKCTSEAGHKNGQSH